MPLRIKISNLNKRRRISPALIRRTAKSVLRKNGIRDAVIDITFVDNRKIKTLNKKYMERRGATDVISFLLENTRPARTEGLIGDIYISSDMAYGNARRFKTPFRKELFLYVIHGMLHLLGYGDKTKSEKNKIRGLETKFLKEFT